MSVRACIGCLTTEELSDIDENLCDSISLRAERSLRCIIIFSIDV